MKRFTEMTQDEFVAFINTPSENSEHQVMSENDNDMAELQEKENERRVLESNKLAQVPPRFKYTRLGDYPVNFLEAGKKFCLDQTDKLFVVSGSTGSGKSTFLTGMIHERAYTGKHPGLYLTGRTIVLMLRQSKSFTAKESEFELLQRLAAIPFVVYDEAGASDDIELERQFFRSFTALRYDNCLPWAVGTNLAAGDFKKFILGDNDPEKDPILSRVNSIIEFHSLVSESHRGE